MTDRGVENVAQTFCGEKEEGRCLGGGPSLHQNHLELFQKTEIHPCVLSNLLVSSGAFQEKKNSNLHKYERTEKFY